MPQLNRPTGEQVVNIMPVSQGAIPSVGLFTAAMVEADYTTNGESSVTAVQLSNAITLVTGAGLDHTDLTQAQYAQAFRAMCLACWARFMELDRVKRLNTHQVCEPVEQYKEKMMEIYSVVCSAWKVLGITDPNFCGAGFGTTSVILEGKVKDTPSDLVSLY